MLLGAGGAARAVAVALLEDGAPELRLVNRSVARARDLAAEIGGPITVVEWNKRADALAGAALLVNTTTLGMADQPPLELDLGPLPAAALVTDHGLCAAATPIC